MDQDLQKYYATKFEITFWQKLLRVVKYFYKGDVKIRNSIPMAYKRLRELPYTNKEVLLATINMITMLGEFELIESYEGIEKIA
jgi:hypothetical protein